MLPYPDVNPVAIRLGPLAIRWYSLAYIAGILLGWQVIAKEHARRPIPNLTPRALDDMVTWAVVGIVGGGRLGYVLFYKPDYYFAHPLEILRVWEGGMSFHGGLIGVTLAFWLFCRKYHIRFLSLIDVLACAVPIGLFFGRIANFINGELFGRPSDAPWAMVFPRGGPLPRHPSELYEAGMEGLILFCLMLFLLKCTRAREKPGRLSGVFIAGYAVSRIIGECFREPDDFLGFFWGFATMGQLLSLPMLLLGVYLIFRKCPSKTS
ncbi:MAG: prolipoprotein diacylglyceryl transferase [Pseudomonadota bacterium]|nr:prolipoprotein diacylglyceryl transferase [Pseudomonadota bacterium]